MAAQDTPRSANFTAWDRGLGFRINTTDSSAIYGYANLRVYEDGSWEIVDAHVHSDEDFLAVRYTFEFAFYVDGETTAFTWGNYNGPSVPSHGDDSLNTGRRSSPVLQQLIKKYSFDTFEQRGHFRPRLSGHAFIGGSGPGDWIPFLDAAGQVITTVVSLA
jgi:hypothetical protein